MYLVGIDISKYKHDCFIATETGCVIQKNLSFLNSKEGFNQLKKLLQSLDSSQVMRIGLEATGHYGFNLKMFLEKNGFSFMEFNPLLTHKFSQAQSLRKTKTDSLDAKSIAAAPVSGIQDLSTSIIPYVLSKITISSSKFSCQTTL